MAFDVINSKGFYQQQQHEIEHQLDHTDVPSRTHGFHFQGNAEQYHQQQFGSDGSGYEMDATTNAMPQPTLMPSIPFSTHTALTVSCITIFSLLFLFVYVQLWMILYYKHRRRSYQTTFLFLCLIWAALRVTLFSFYFRKRTIILANNFSPFIYWLLYSCPVVLQFTTLVLLVSFFSQVVIKARHPENFRKFKFRVLLLCAISVIVFTGVNIVCGIIAQTYLANPCHVSFIAVAVRVAINGFLFVVHGIALSYWIFSLNKVANARALLESRGTNLCQSWTTCIFIVFIFASRALYNVFALALPKILPNFGYGWINVTDQADLVDLDEGYNYVVYLAALLLWEILPTLVVTIFFRVQKPTNIPEANLDDLTSRQQYFFDNPRRYDSDEDLGTKYGPGSLSGSNRHKAINNSQSSGDSGTATARYDPALSRAGNSSSRAYNEPRYNGT